MASLALRRARVWGHSMVSPAQSRHTAAPTEKEQQTTAVALGSRSPDAIPEPQTRLQQGRVHTLARQITLADTVRKALTQGVSAVTKARFESTLDGGAISAFRDAQQLVEVAAEAREQTHKNPPPRLPAMAGTPFCTCGLHEHVPTCH